MQQQRHEGQGQAASRAVTGPARANSETDPLGRPLRGRDYGDDTTVKVPGEIDVQRARRILEELRSRFGENFRPQLELDYIERLLRDLLIDPDGRGIDACRRRQCVPGGAPRARH